MRDEIIIISALIVLSGVVALEFGFTTAIAELVVGMVAGQFIDLNNGGILDVLADLGILTLMYVAGLEIDLDRLQKKLRPSVAIGSASFIFPFVSVYILAYFFLGLGENASILSAIALSTTSMAIVYPMLRQGGELDDDGRTILSAAMITDVLSMSALGIAFTPNPWLIVILVLGLFAFAKVFPLLGSRIFGYYRGNVAEFEFKIILLLLLAVAVVSEQAGFESAIIAFIMGMITSELVIQHENLELKLRGIVFGFFAPIFFFSVGLSISLGTLAGGMDLLFLFFAVCFAAKYLGTYVVSKLFMPGKEKYIAALFNSRLSLGIIACVLGFEEGILSLELYSAIIGAVVVSSILSAILCRGSLSAY